MFYLIAKFSLSVLCVLASILVARQGRWIEKVADRLPSLGWLCAGYLLLRIVVLWGVHDILGMKIPSDVAGYFEHASLVLNGLVPNRDFASPYGFLFTYALAGAVFVYRDPLAILALFQIAECVGLFLLLRAVAERTRERSMSILLLAVYATNPIVAVNLWLGGQDECLLILVLGVAASLASSGRKLLIVSLPGLLFLATKMFSAWILAPLALLRSWGERIGMAAVLAGLLAAVMLSGASVVNFEFSRGQQSADRLADMVTSGNVWFVLDRILGIPVPSSVITVVALGTLAAMGGWLWLRAPRNDSLRFLLFGSAALVLCFQLTYRMTFPFYLAPAVAALASLAVMERRSTAGLAVWAGLWSFESTLWFWLKEQAHVATLAWIGFVCYQLVLIGCTVAVLVRTLAMYGQPRIGDRLPLPAAT